MIQVQNIRKSFDGVEVLRGASLDVADGEIVALIGPSGGGKSVFLKHVVGLMQPDSGRIVVDGEDMCCLGRKTRAALRNRFGFLFQNGALFDSMTVFDNVAFPLREKTRLGESEIGSRVRAELEQVGLKDAESKYPAQLSGGMARRAALARSLVRSPSILLFDEPTTGLDPIIVHAIHDLITATHRRLGFSGIIVSHEIPSIFDIVQKVAMLYQGAIQFVGTPEEIFASEDPVVDEFIRGSMPSPRFRFKEPGPARPHAGRRPEETA